VAAVNHTPRAEARRILRVAARVTAVGGSLMLLGFVLEPRRALAAYLVAWSAGATIAMGAIAFLVLGYATNARWVAVVRRVAETVGSALWPIAILFLPLVLGADLTWPWVAPTPELAAELAPRATWLGLPFFVLRTAIYLGVFLVAFEVLRAWSRRRDGVAPPELPPARPPEYGPEPPRALDRERAFASAMLAPCGLALTFAAFDWLMSLQPTWWSSAFGLYVTCGALGGGLATIILLAARGQEAGLLPLTRHHFHAMGRLLLAFVMLWGYIAFFQAMLIQIADLPDEVPFYLARIDGGWATWTVVLVACHLAIPLVLLVPRATKRSPHALAAIAALLLAAHYLDLWWLVIPPTGAGPYPSWTDAAAIATVGGGVVIGVALRARGVPHVADGDPYLRDALHYRSTT
jgi:hypothetical protein